MTAPAARPPDHPGNVRGWCPGALRPMPSGDGLVLRIRPHAGRLTPDQALALAELAERHGNGLIDLGSRAHLQLRGIDGAALPRIWQRLSELGLLDPDPESEAQRNILTSPLHRPGDETLALVAQLEAALLGAAQAGLPQLPAKFGFAIDTAALAVLGRAPADIRIERAATGLILRPEGMDLGESVTAETAIPRAMDLARWFLEQSRSREAGQMGAPQPGQTTRMARLLAAGVRPPVSATTPPLSGLPPVPGPGPAGLCLALPFGQMQAATLRGLAIAPLRLTPWRALILEGVTEVPALSGLISSPDDALLQVSACTGAPGCLSAEAPTRDLARALAPLLPKGCHLHVSGCAKGCAHPGPATLTLTARQGRFDLIGNGRASAPPDLRALAPDTLPSILRGRLDPYL